MSDERRCREIRTGYTTPLEPMYIQSVVRMALAEDIGNGDLTTELVVPADAEPAEAEIRAKQHGVLAGMALAMAVFSAYPSYLLEPESVDETSGMLYACDDGFMMEPGDTLAVVTGQPATILTAERVALNFLQRMSGIATLTNRYVQLVSHTKAKIADTRKTTPGLRRLEKYAVTVGGGVNHRFNLSDGILIKDNHIAAAGGVTAAVAAAKKHAPHLLKIECEVTNLEQLAEAIAAGADIVLLDNMPLDMLKQAVRLAAKRVITEASGGVNEQNVAAIAETGIDLISVGALTHSAPALDISLEFK